MSAQSITKYATTMTHRIVHLCLITSILISLYNFSILFYLLNTLRIYFPISQIKPDTKFNTAIPIHIPIPIQIPFIIFSLIFFIGFFYLLNRLQIDFPISQIKRYDKPNITMLILIPIPIEIPSINFSLMFFILSLFFKVVYFQVLPTKLRNKRK